MSGSTAAERAGAHRAVGLTFTLVIATYLISGIAASISCRGLYQDAAYYLYRMAERDAFYLVDPNRTTVQVLRQAPVVALLNIGDFPLMRLGQVFSLSMLLWPPALVALCWFIAPADRKALTLFPALHLLLGFSTMSFQPVSEGAIATSYLWILLFLILFRTRALGSQIAFLALCLPAFKLHEAACLFTPVLMVATALRFKTTAARRERLFLSITAVLLAAIFAYQMRWMIYPRNHTDRAGAIDAMVSFGYLYFENHFNLPVVTALVAVAALVGVWCFRPAARRGDRSTAIAVAFAIYCVGAIATAWLVEASLSPPAQSLSRFNGVYASLVLGTLTTALANRPAGQFSWWRGPLLAIVIMLAVTQLATDLAATARWRQYLADFEGRLANGEGLLDWRGGLPATSDRRDREWRLMTVVWVHPIMSIILAKGGDVRTILDYPPTATYRPIDLSDPGKLAPMHGVSYRSYQQVFDRNH